MPGQYYDSQSGLFYNWNRYYNPAIGRYVSVDPIGLDGGLNTFNYVEANPVMYTDPEGLFAPAIAAGVRACLANPICRSIAIDIAKRTGQALADAAQAAMESWNGTTPVPQVCPPASAPGVDGPAGVTKNEMGKESKKSGKEKASDIPSYAKGYQKDPNENCHDFALSIIEQEFGRNDRRYLDRGTGSDYSKIKKNCERGGK